MRTASCPRAVCKGASRRQQRGPQRCKTPLLGQQGGLQACKVPLQGQQCGPEGCRTPLPGLRGHLKPCKNIHPEGGLVCDIDFGTDPNVMRAHPSIRVAEGASHQLTSPAAGR